MNRNSVSTVQFLMDTYPQVAELQNLQNQNALHICLESNALECYQTLIRCRSPSLDIRSEDRFGQIPVNLWKKVMEEKREMSDWIGETALTHRLLWLPSRRVQNADSLHGALYRPPNLR